ncbi:50S ribosomal protein L3 [bacterium]|jgi:large subunit ribosomal protein L3|nr:50S ribosomal protein L3 [bacterium]
MNLKGIIGKKLGMTQIFDSETKQAIPVTIVEAGPCTITQVRTEKTSGREIAQLGFLEQKPQRVKKPQAGHFKKANTPAFRILREFARPVDANPGDQVTLSIFAEQDLVDVTGTSKGRGFQGVVKRHNSHRGDKTHGGHCYRIPGSIGNCSTPSKVWKGVKMPGRMGNVRKTVQNLRVVKCDTERNLIYLEGAVPGCRNGIVYLKEAVKA